jgi:hypothetical protein
MKRMWSAEELSEQWSVGPEERAKLPDKAAERQLGDKSQLTFRRKYGRFPEGRDDFASVVIAHLAIQLHISESAIATYDWGGRTGRRHRRIITEVPWRSAVRRRTDAAFFGPLANRGYDLRLQDYLGQRDPKHTMHYTRVAVRRFEGLWR